MPSHANKAIIFVIVGLLSIENTLTKSAKINFRPVHEVTNEQPRSEARSDQALPYSNPLAGNSQQNSRQHALHQQAMFNAERTRQHRAQIQRWTKAPIQMDSYMKAYHESQENHHLALEKQQTRQTEPNKEKQLAQTIATVTPKIKQRPTLIRRPEVAKRLKTDQRIQATDAIRNKQDKSRNHRSQGSIDYFMNPAKYKTVYINPSQFYEEGVTIKPNGNVGIAQNEDQKPSKLYTEAIPSNTQYVYPKQYNQMQEYQSAQDIASLNLLLKKPAHDQLSELKALVHPTKASALDNTQEELVPTSLNQPIDLYFYLKDSPIQSLSEQYEQNHYAQLPQNYAQDYSNQISDVPKDHTPITEEVDDVADINKPGKLTSFGVQPVLAHEEPEELDSTTVKNNNYYKVEVASQTISSGYKPKHHGQPKQQIKYILNQNAAEEDVNKEVYQSIDYGNQPLYYKNHGTDEEDDSEVYLHNNSQQKGIQHLTGDGTGVSAYGEDSENLHYAANYEFGYRVRDHHSGNDFGHHEAKSGEKTNGQYHVLLPDGRLQKVQYWAGPSGFHADISYEHLQEHGQE